uniref:Uncharacterized protein n=1 Tax=Ditylenchus dipsaci TaxID=166011 RepID=A0A915DAF1_9BILA
MLREKYSLQGGCTWVAVVGSIPDSGRFTFFHWNTTLIPVEYHLDSSGIPPKFHWNPTLLSLEHHQFPHASKEYRDSTVS